MILKSISILNFKNIREADLSFSPKLNCLVGLNGMGKTNVLDAIYYLSFTKSAFNSVDSQNITHSEESCLIKGYYDKEEISCGLRKGVKKQFRRGKKDYQRLIEHIGLIPLVLVSPEDNELIGEGSDCRRRFLDSVIAQYNREYLQALTAYNALLKQRNVLLKQYEDANDVPIDLFEVINQQMVPLAKAIYKERTSFMERFVPIFADLYKDLSGGTERVSLRYVSQLQDRDLAAAMTSTLRRDLILGWTSQGVHKDDLEMLYEEYPLKRVASQGQQKTFVLAMKLAQALFLNRGDDKPILLLDDIFDKLDSERMERLVALVHSERFGQIFITDTDRQHLSQIIGDRGKVFMVEKGRVVENGKWRNEN